MNANKKQLAKVRRAFRTRARIQGTEKKPRLSVARSLKHISAQIINDEKGVTLTSASDHDVKSDAKPVTKAFEVGKMLAAKAVAIGIETVIFDRGSFRYHGRVAALANGAREGGLKF